MVAAEDPISTFAVVCFVLRGARGALPLSFLGGAAGRLFLILVAVEDWVRTLMEELGRILREVPGRVSASAVTGKSATILREEAVLNLLFACRDCFISGCNGTPRAKAYKIFVSIKA